VIETGFPKAGHLARPVSQRGEGVELRAVMRLATVGAATHQSGLLEDAEVLGDNGLGDAGAGCQGAYGLFSLAAKPLEDGPPGGVGERSEERVLCFRHEQRIPRWLWINV